MEGQPNKRKTKYTVSLDYSSVCNIGSRVVWVSMEEIYYQVLFSHGPGVERYILTYKVSSSYSV